MSSAPPKTEPNEQPASRPSLQFSIRDLLALTVVVSICLAIGTYFAGLIFVVVVIGLTQTAMLLLADWLIRPQNRHILAFVTAASWITAGSGLITLGLSTIFGLNELSLPVQSHRGLKWIVGSIFVVAGVACIVIASRRWRQLAAKSPTSGGLKKTI